MQDWHAGCSQPRSAAVVGTVATTGDKRPPPPEHYAVPFLFSPFHARLDGCAGEAPQPCRTALASRLSQPRGDGEGVGR